MIFKRAIIASISLIALASCTPLPGTNTPPPVSGLPPIGGEGDLRVGAAPPAHPSDVDIPIFNPKKKSKGITKIRQSALLEAAQGWGSQMGYARRGHEIETLLQDYSTELNVVYDFNRVVSLAPAKAGYIVPPIVSRSYNAFRVDSDGKEASVADEYLTIISPGEISPRIPNWRDYLLFTPLQPEQPARSLFPQNPKEKALFEEWLHEGWRAGLKQADAEIFSRLDRLSRDFTGMLQYRHLVSKGMMDRMVLRDADFGVTGGGDEMRIGSRVVQIVSDAQFEINPKRWSVRSISDRERLIVATGEIPPISLINRLSEDINSAPINLDIIDTDIDSEEQKREYHEPK